MTQDPPIEPSGEQRPLSRREMREAAQRAAGPSDAPAAPTDDDVPTPSTAAVPAPAVPTVPKAAQPPVEPEAAESVTGLPAPIAEPAQTADAPATAGIRRGRTADSEDVNSLTAMDDLFAAEERAPDTKGKRRKRKRGCLVGIIVLVLVLAGVGAGVAAVWNAFEPQIRGLFGWTEPADYAAGLEGEPVKITISAGDAGQQISTKLYEAKITKTPNAFYTYLVDSKQNPTFYPGVYQLRTKLPSEEALTMLEDPKNRLENTVLVREGDSTGLIYQAISEQLGISVDDVKAAAANPADYGVTAATLEGWLFPATYEFDDGTTVQQAIQKMVDRMKQSLEEHGVAPEDQERILTIASIVQREGQTSDFPKVARVILNRLQPDNTETHGLLQMDSTVQYGVGKLHEGIVSTTDEDRANDNPYNTYLHPGLPPGPIASPGDDAIAAAMKPADGSWMYFVTVNLDTGETIFSDTYAEQQAAEDKLTAWCKANPDSGC